jgi:hypothetical protein
MSFRNGILQKISSMGGNPSPATAVEAGVRCNLQVSRLQIPVHDSGMLSRPPVCFGDATLKL